MLSAMPNPRGVINAVKMTGPKPRWPTAARYTPVCEAAE
jgi:hypothetical protein